MMKKLYLLNDSQGSDHPIFLLMGRTLGDITSPTEFYIYEK